MDHSTGTTTTRRTNVIRADRTQTEILRNALVETSNPSPDQLAALSTKTNLPSKWISNWFSRQRVKVNKLSGIRRTAHDRLRVKQEALDGIDSLAAASSPATDSVSETTDLFASSSTATLDILPEIPPPKTQPSTRKRKVKQALLNDERGEQITSLPRELRSRKRKADDDMPGPAGRRMKAERLEDVEAAPLRYTPVDNAATILVPGTNLASSTQWPVLTAPPVYKLPGVAPPQRSPMAAVQPREAVRTTPRSGLAKAHMQLQEALSSTVSTGNHAAVAPRKRGKGAKGGAARSSGRNPYSQEPLFRVQQLQSNLGSTDNYGYNENQPPPSNDNNYAQNGGESQAASTSVGRIPSYTSQTNGLGGSTVHDVSEDGFLHHQYGVRPLGPAFHWEHHNYMPPMGMVGTVLAAPVILKAEEQRYQTFIDDSQKYQQPERNIYPHSTYNQTFALQNPTVPMSSLFQSLQAQATAYADVLDSSKAPLIHLRDILYEFRDENGSYARLLVPEERENMMKCLLDDNLLPFEKAMALSLLSRLGFTWN